MMLIRHGAVMAGVLDALGGLGDRLAHVQADFADPLTPAWVIEQAVERFGHVDVLIANHARNSKQSLEEVTVTELDLAWAVNARGSVLLTQAFAAQHDDRRSGGRVILFTSGQHLAPMSRSGGAPGSADPARRGAYAPHAPHRALYEMKGDDGKRRYTVQQIPDRLGVSRATIYRHLDPGKPISA
ncbi:SDR family NAD(P)-dependent oxidoreductase [Nonomuraea sp. M3C6]|uniref:SDR family NAD(P)-dependent oxidoreductase n=1 Tax=Nonomuraea marmarensis TaxID=3351344 RepID=A0ABW7ATM2_9ACTN